MYHEHSIKSMERSRCSCGEKLLIKGENTRKPRDWKKFLSNADNKGQLISILLKVWGSDKLAYKLKNRHVICIREGDAFLLLSEDGKKTEITEIQELPSSQEETDSRVILYCRYGKNIGYKYIRVKSPDMDFFFILLHYAQSFTETTILYETGKGNKKRLINMNNIAEKFSQEECSALLGLHAFTGCDTCSAFKGTGKIKPIKVLQKNAKFNDMLARLGDNWEVSDDMFSDAEELTCALYGKLRFKSVNELRFHLLKAKCGSEDKITNNANVDISNMPPCSDSLREHVRRVNYQVASGNKHM